MQNTSYDSSWQQPLLDNYMKTLQQNGYVSGQNMGQDWWGQPGVTGAIESLKQSSAPYADAGRSYAQHTGGQNPYAKFLQGVPQGDAVTGHSFGDQFGAIASNPILQIFTALATAGQSGLLNGTALSGLGEAASALPSAIGASLPSFSEAGNSIGGLFGDATLGSDISGGLSGLYSGAKDALSGIGHGLSDLFGPSSTGSGLSGDFASGMGGAPTLDPSVNGARDLTSLSAGSPAEGAGFTGAPSVGAPSAGGGAAGGFASGNDLTDLFAKGITDPGASTEFGSNLPTGAGFTDTLSTNTGGGKVGGLASLFAGQGGAGNLINGLLRTGITGSTYNPNTAGYTGIANAANQAGANYQPFLTAGTGAAKTLADLFGTNGPAAATQASNNWQNTPGYQFARGQGISALDASAAAKGNVLSGNQIKAVQDYGTGLADNTYNQYVQNLMQQAGQGQSAAGGVGTAELTGANAMAQLGQNKANNKNQIYGNLADTLFPSSSILSLLAGNKNSGLLSLFQ